MKPKNNAAGGVHYLDWESVDRAGIKAGVALRGSGDFYPGGETVALPGLNLD